jgi:hypothetical protein
MVQYRVKDPTGQEHIIEGPDNATPDEVISQAQKLIPTASQNQEQTQPQPSFMDTVGSVAKNVLTAPVRMVKNLTPEKMSTQLPAIGAVAGEMIYPPGGGAVGAGLGQIGKRIADLGYGRVQPSEAMNPIKEAITPMVQTAVAGIPAVSGVFQAGKKTVAQAITKGLAKAGQTLSGAKQDVLEQAAKQGLLTYTAPSLPKAQKIFSQALGPEGQVAMKQSVSDTFDPAVGQARSIATEIGTKIEKGEPITAIDALKARQATDRVISATPVTDKLKRKALYDWRSKFDDIMSSQSGDLKNASDLYRKAIVKNQLLSPTRLNKSGEPSAFLPLVLGAGGRSAEGILQTLLGTSPFAWGAGATTVGAIPPVVRQAALASFIDKITTKNKEGLGGQ